MAYFRVEPFGHAAEDARMGLLTSVLANAHRNPKKRRQPWKPEDFMMFWQEGGSSDAPDQQVLRGKLDALMKVWGGKKGLVQAEQRAKGKGR